MSTRASELELGRADSLGLTFSFFLVAELGTDVRACVLLGKVSPTELHVRRASSRMGRTLNELGLKSVQNYLFTQSPVC